VCSSPASRGQWSDPDAGKVSFGDYAVAWLDDRKVADRTRERHESVVRLHLLPVFGDRPLASITTAQVRAWRTACLTRTGEPTVVKAYQVLRAILNTAVDDELIRRNPCRVKRADRYDVPERPVLSVGEVYAWLTRWARDTGYWFSWRPSRLPRAQGWAAAAEQLPGRLDPRAVQGGHHGRRALPRSSAHGEHPRRLWCEPAGVDDQDGPQHAACGADLSAHGQRP
jgi:hypothetical protein